MFGHLVAGGRTKYTTSTHFLKKECDISVILRPEFLRFLDSRKIYAELALSVQSIMLDHGIILGE